MKLDAQVHQRLSKSFSGHDAPCCSHAQFARIVGWVTEIVREAEAGKLQAERITHLETRLAVYEPPPQVPVSAPA